MQGFVGAERRPRRHVGGFTLIELLVVIGIISILAGLLITGIGSMTQRAKQKKTEVMIAAIDNALQSYFSDFRDYPPDGFDAPGDPTNGGVDVPQLDATTLTANDAIIEQRMNSSCLIFFLMARHVKTTRMGADGGGNSAFNTQTKLVGPYLPFATLQHDNFSRVDPVTAYPVLSDPLCELLDGFGFPIEYDRVRTAADLQSRDSTTMADFHPDANFFNNILPGLVQTGENFSATGALAPDEDVNEGVDPRREPNADGDKDKNGTGSPVRSVNVGSYDVWAHGHAWTNARDDAGNFTGQ